MIEVKEGRYFAVIAFVYGDAGQRDWLCEAWRDLPNGEWQINYRFRYYVDDKAHDSDDQKNWYRAVGKPEMTEQLVIDGVRTIAEALRDTGFNDTMSVLEVRTSDPAAILRTLSAQPWCHIKEEKPR